MAEDKATRAPNAMVVDSFMVSDVVYVGDGFFPNERLESNECDESTSDYNDLLDFSNE